MTNALIPGVLRKPVLLLILDGFGYSDKTSNNAIVNANTPNLDRYFKQWPNSLIQTSGNHVGLPVGQMGNSEVGHLTLGCGSIIRQDLVSINEAIESGDFFENPALLTCIQRVKEKNNTLHLLGLVSDGGVHSDIGHLKALIKLCHMHQVKPVLHMISDGRDTAPKSALKTIQEIEPLLLEADGYIASIMGRFYGMDRDSRWDRTEKAWRLLMLAKGNNADSAKNAILQSYEQDINDEFLKPTCLPGHSPLNEDDEIFFFNFRKDRPRQTAAALSVETFTEFDRGDSPRPRMTCMMPYDKKQGLDYIYEPEHPETTLGEIVSQAGIKQFHCAETEKYAHVTYFFNGGRAEPYNGETQLLIPSPSVETYDLKPEMSAKEVGEAIIDAVKLEQYGFIVVNFANADMVGHTGMLDASIRAVEALDVQVGKIMEIAQCYGYSVVLTADHGNCEEIKNENTGEPHTQHTTNPVPCLIMDEECWQLSSNAGLANIAPTILQLMGLKKPEAMEPSLLEKSAGNSNEYLSLDGVA